MTWSSLQHFYQTGSAINVEAAAILYPQLGLLFNERRASFFKKQWPSWRLWNYDLTPFGLVMRRVYVVMIWGIFMLSLELGQKARPLLGLGWSGVLGLSYPKVFGRNAVCVWNFSSYYFGGWWGGGGWLLLMPGYNGFTFWFPLRFLFWPLYKYIIWRMEKYMEAAGLRLY